MPEPERRYPRTHPFFYPFFHKLFGLLFRILTKIHIQGLENIPREGPFIIYLNHLSHIDTPAVFVGFGGIRRMNHLAAEKYEHHIFSPLLRTGGAIFIDRGEVDRDALKQGLAVLEDGGGLGIAIEGTRSRTGGLQEGKTGVAYFATRANVPLVPAVVWGTQNALSSLMHLRRADVQVRFGKPFKLPEGRARSEDLDRYTDELMLVLARMLPDEYRGVYRGRPELAAESPLQAIDTAL
jgi:1-acyl-sn-glycerol-3-phosphate acyltransferase